MTRSLISYAASLGGLRLLLFALAVSAALAAPDPGARTVIAWPLVVPTLIAPAIAPIIFVIVLLDLVMTKVMSAGEKDAARRSRQIMFSDALVAGVLVFSYLPFFLALGR